MQHKRNKNFEYLNALKIKMVHVHQILQMQKL